MSEHYIYGLHAVASLLNHRPGLVQYIGVRQTRDDARMEELLLLARHSGIEVRVLTTQQMQQQFPNMVHQGIIACTSSIPEYHERDLPQLMALMKKPGLILILDGVTDPHNLGACLRSAEAAGVDFVICPKDRSATITAVVSKVASGAAETLPFVRVVNLARTLEFLKQEGVWIYGAEGSSKTSLYQLDFRSSIALVMGSEGSGMRRLTREHCDDLFSLPMQGFVSSLNVSVATGISLYEVVRQRQGLAK